SFLLVDRARSSMNQSLAISIKKMVKIEELLCGLREASVAARQQRSVSKKNSSTAVSIKGEREILIRTCGQLYARWRSRGRVYRRVARAGGLPMHVRYIDTATSPTLAEHKHNNKRTPVVLAIHGAPGSYEDFDFLIEHLKQQSVRVIAPNFPAMRETVSTIFKHSADEKAAYLTDFLRAIQVDTIDLLISHSSAVFPSLLMINERQINIRSLALFNPPGHRLPRSMKPTWFKCGSVKFYQNKFGRAVFRLCGPQFLRIVGAPVKVDNMDNVMLSATVMKHSRCKRVKEQLQQLSAMKLPTLLLFSENDKLIEKEIFYEMTHLMSLDSTKFDYYDENGKLERSGSSDSDWIRVIVFKAGGHYSYLNYAPIVGQAITQLVHRVAPVSKLEQSQQQQVLTNNVTLHLPKDLNPIVTSLSNQIHLYGH
ncbi:hypothetical protein GZH46_00878, partial [Fragariocoptes setiger]